MTERMPPAPAPARPTPPPALPLRRRVPRAAVLATALGVLALVVVASLAIGTRQVPLDVVWAAFANPDQSWRKNSKRARAS